MNFTKSLAFIFIILAIGCKSDRPEPEPISSKILQNFNELAKESFLKNYDSFDLSPLRSWEKKNLKNEVENNIDQSNNWALEVVDSFYIRNYNGDPMDTHYSFVSNKSGKFYFIYLPYFYNFWLQDSLYNVIPNAHENTIQLKDSVNYSILSLNSPMMDDFFEKEVFNPKRPIKEQIQQADHLLFKAFPYLFSRGAQRDDVLDELNSYPKKNSNYVMTVLNPILKKEHPISGQNFDYRIASNFFGFIIATYSLDEYTPNKAKLTIYFIPKRKRGGLITM